MAKYRKMLNDLNADYIQSLMRLIETQSKETISKWCVSYAEEHLLPIYEKHYKDDMRPRNALAFAKNFLNGTVKLAEVKDSVNGCRIAARESEGNAAAQGAVRAIDTSASATFNPTGSIGLALYGALAISYDHLGTNIKWEEHELFAAGECVKMENALRAISVENEPNPAKIKWNC